MMHELLNHMSWKSYPVPTLFHSVSLFFVNSMSEMTAGLPVDPSKI